MPDWNPVDLLPGAWFGLLAFLLDRALRRWYDAVVKPAVSASAYGTWRTAIGTAGADQPRFEQQSRVQDLLVQDVSDRKLATAEKGGSCVLFGQFDVVIFVKHELIALAEIEIEGLRDFILRRFQTS